MMRMTLKDPSERERSQKEIADKLTKLTRTIFRSPYHGYRSSLPFR